MVTLVTRTDDAELLEESDELEDREELEDRDELEDSEKLASSLRCAELDATEPSPATEKLRLELLALFDELPPPQAAKVEAKIKARNRRTVELLGVIMTGSFSLFYVGVKYSLVRPKCASNKTFD